MITSRLFQVSSILSMSLEILPSSAGRPFSPQFPNSPNKFIFEDHFSSLCSWIAHSMPESWTRKSHKSKKIFLLSFSPNRHSHFHLLLVLLSSHLPPPILLSSIPFSVLCPGELLLLLKTSLLFSARTLLLLSHTWNKQKTRRKRACIRRQSPSLPCGPFSLQNNWFGAEIMCFTCQTPLSLIFEWSSWLERSDLLNTFDTNDVSLSISHSQLRFSNFHIHPSRQLLHIVPRFSWPRLQKRMSVVRYVLSPWANGSKHRVKTSGDWEHRLQQSKLFLLSFSKSICFIKLYIQIMKPLIFLTLLFLAVPGVLPKSKRSDPLFLAMVCQDDCTIDVRFLVSISLSLFCISQLLRVSPLPITSPTTTLSSSSISNSPQTTEPCEKPPLTWQKTSTSSSSSLVFPTRTAQWQRRMFGIWTFRRPTFTRSVLSKLWEICHVESELFVFLTYVCQFWRWKKWWWRNRKMSRMAVWNLFDGKERTCGEPVNLVYYFHRMYGKMELGPIHL